MEFSRTLHIHMLHVYEPEHDKNQQNDLCVQRKIRSAWASAQSETVFAIGMKIIGSLATYKAHSEDSIRLGERPG